MIFMEETTSPQTVTVYLRVGESDVINVVGKVDMHGVLSEITEENRQPGDAPEATQRLAVTIPTILRKLATQLEYGDDSPPNALDRSMLYKMLVDGKRVLVLSPHIYQAREHFDEFMRNATLPDGDPFTYSASRLEIRFDVRRGRINFMGGNPTVISDVIRGWQVDAVIQPEGRIISPFAEALITRSGS